MQDMNKQLYKTLDICWTVKFKACNKRKCK